MIPNNLHRIRLRLLRKEADQDHVKIVCSCCVRDLRISGQPLKIIHNVATEEDICSSLFLELQIFQLEPSYFLDSIPLLLKWRTSLVAWANDAGVKVYNAANDQRITFNERPRGSPCPEIFLLHLVWQLIFLGRKDGEKKFNTTIPSRQATQDQQ
ncbi:hypothetical protein ACOSQ2_027944 [Xanthoceras sorbifolium]